MIKIRRRHDFVNVWFKVYSIVNQYPPIQNLIREAKIHQIPSIMQTAVRDGMITMDKSLEELVKSGKIDPGAAKAGH